MYKISLETEKKNSLAKQKTFSQFLETRAPTVVGIMQFLFYTSCKIITFSIN